MSRLVAKKFAPKNARLAEVGVSLPEKIEAFNADKINPGTCFIKDSAEQQALLKGDLTFPLQWATISKHFPGKMNTEGMSSSAFFRKALKTDKNLAWQLYELEIVDITTDTLFDCCADRSDEAMEIAHSILLYYEDIPMGYWKRSLSECLIQLLYGEFSGEMRAIAAKLVARGADINTYQTGTHILQILVQRYHQFPQNLTSDKLEFMFECGLSLNKAVRVSSSHAYQPPQQNLMYMFTNGIPIDDYIAMLQIIKKYQK